MIERKEVERDQYGDWTHPALVEFFGDREYVPADEWQAWESEHGIDTKLSVMEQEVDEDDPAWIRYFDEGEPGSLGWNPEPPGPEWHILSIHDTEEGPVVIWYREKPAEVPGDE